MQEQALIRPQGITRWEVALIMALVALLVILAVAGKGRRQRGAIQDFLKRAPQVQAALEAFAADHQGRFPPDAMFTGRPPGLGDRYIAWENDWKIDYEVHSNGRGGKYVCLEFCGPYAERRYFGLCNNPRFRRLYGKGQPVPGFMNRLWVIREEAPIMDPKELRPKTQPQPTTAPAAHDRPQTPESPGS